MSNPRAIHLLVRFLVAAALAACAAPQPGGAGAESGAPAPAPPPPDAAAPVGLSLDRSTYAPGGRVELTIVNRTGDQFAFNPCTREVERWGAGAWVAQVDSNRVCTMEAWILDARATRKAQTDLPPRMDAGVYRLVIRLTREGAAPGGGAVRAESASFRIE